MGQQSNPIEIFRAGRHTTAAGAALDFSDAQLQACATAYDPALHEAPIVVGHPKDNGPAYGWVSGLDWNGQVLAAKPQQVDPQFAEMVGAGRFKKISASFYLPDSPHNPKPGVLYLRHVGFLGALPPSVKGLKDASFAEGEEGVVEFADWDDMQNASLWGRMRDFFISKFGLDTADQVIPSYAVDQLKQAAATEPDDDPSSASSFSEHPPTRTPKEPLMAGKDPAVQAAEFAERERGITEREAALAQREADARKASWASFCDGLVVAGKLTPAQRVHVMTLATQLPPTVQVAEFAEDGTKTGERSAVDVLRALVELLPKQVDFTERAKAGETAIAVDLTSAEAIAAAAVNFQETEAKAGRTVSHTEAVQHVVAQHEGAAQ